MEALPQPGQVVAGKYRLVRVLGEGGMGVVYEAEHTRLGQKVALKMLLPELVRVDDLVQRFDREARAASQLKSRHTARVMDVDVTEGGVPYMVLELLHGRDLDAELGARKAIPVGEAVDYVLQVCAAIDEAHALGIVHRDLKPSNVFLSDERGGRVAKVLDFGISKVSSEGDARLTAAEAVMGTAMYMAPEQVKSSRNVDARADIWSLGVVLYELLSGRAPFVGTPTQVVAAIVSEDAPAIGTLVDVPAPIASAIERCLARDPAGRFGSVRELMRALAPFAPAGCLGALSAQESLRDEPSRAAPSPLPTAARDEGKTAVSWGSPGPERGSPLTKWIGVGSIVVALGLVGVIAGQIYGRAQGPGGKAVASGAPSGSTMASPSTTPTAAAPSVAAVTTALPAASVSAQPTASAAPVAIPVAQPSSASKAGTIVKPKVEPSAVPPPVPSAPPKPPPVVPPTPTVDPNHL